VTTLARILLVEDDQTTRDAVARNLEAHGFRITASGDVADALRRWDAERPDLILLDLGLPDLDGATVVRHVRRDATTPILILSARTDERVKVATLEAGADDYVTKPFGMEELLARSRAALRRRGVGEPDAPHLSYGTLDVDLAKQLVTLDGEQLHLTPTEYSLLEALVTNPGKLLTHQWLLRRVWGQGYGTETTYLRTYIRALRKKLGDDASAPGMIVTEPGVGYRWIAETGS
jgi:two-component system, OmpR family, KDP operon response regulator KdpE